MVDAALHDMYEVACLAGGMDRVVDAAVVALLESGRVRAQRSGELTVVDPTRRGAVEAAVLDAIGTRGWRTIGMVRARARQDERLRQLTDRLVQDGLLARRLARRLGMRGPALAPTAAGRRVLREVRAHPPAWASGPDAGQVALGGTGRMADRELRAAVFDPARPPRTPRHRRQHYHHGGGQAAHVTGACGSGTSAGGCGAGGCGGG